MSTAEDCGIVNVQTEGLGGSAESKFVPEELKQSVIRDMDGSGNWLRAANGVRIRESSPMDLTQDGHTTSTLQSGQADASMTDKCSILYTAI